GYLLKDRVSDVKEFIAAVRRVAEGGSAIDPTIVSQLLGRRRADTPLARVTPRARGTRVDGRGPLEPGDCGAPGDHRTGRAEAHHGHLRQARPERQRRRPPPRARGTRLPPLVGQPARRVGRSRWW